MTAIESLLSDTDREVRRVIEARLSGRELSVDDAVVLCGARGASLLALIAAADSVRRAQVGDDVSYVVNRNINFTNVCVKACRFCAFARTRKSEEGYFLPIEEIVRRAHEAQALGATEVCVQAGLAPGIDGRFYVDLTRALRRACPELHLHAFSPEEIKYAAGLCGVPVRRLLEELRDAGLGSLPGTSAEILDDRVRARIAPGRITTAEWIEVVSTAHALGIPTTSTLMFGHVESDLERMLHLELLRSIQRETRGFTELVPLSFVHEEAPMTLRQQLPELRPGPTGDEVIRLFCISRLFLGEHIPNLQASWVKEGMRQAQWLLSCGANDLGGTLINESISTAAGAAHGERQSPASLRRVIRDAGRVPVERNMRYQRLRAFSAEPTPDEDGPLDRIDDMDRFGSYDELTRDERFKFRLAIV